MGARITLDLFAGPGGWDEAARMLGIPRVAGIEMDAAACRTRAAAGHVTVRADVAAWNGPWPPAAGLTASPPCGVFSAAGKRAGVALTGELADLIRDAFAGRKTRAAHRKRMAAVLRDAWWPSPKMTRAERMARIWAAVRSASLVAEPARFIRGCRPEWVALEQVPAVLPLWRVYAAELRALGYSAWTGELNAADYGVPQVRKRAILIASRVRRVERPAPTHYDARKGMQLWGDPWVSMAQALGWGATGRPAPTTTAGGASTGGAEPFGHRDRDALEAEQAAGRWTLRTSFGIPSMAAKNGSHEMDPAARPAHAVTTKAKDWSLHRSRGASVGRRDHPLDEPAPTITGAGGKPGGNLTWVRERPATSVLGDPRIGRPGHKGREPGEESHFAVDSVRITVEEAAVLQSFPPDYPWRGTKTAQFAQVGNAVPPLLALHILAMATGSPIPSLSAAAGVA